MRLYRNRDACPRFKIERGTPGGVAAPSVLGSRNFGRGVPAPRRAWIAYGHSEDNVARFRNRLRDRWRAGIVTRAEVEAKVGAWIAHAENADTWRLRRAMFEGG
jgi:hypothetical protein